MRHFKGFFIHPTEAFKFVHTLWKKTFASPSFACYFYSKMNGFAKKISSFETDSYATSSYFFKISSRLISDRRNILIITNYSLREIVMARKYVTPGKKTSPGLLKRLGIGIFRRYGRRFIDLRRSVSGNGFLFDFNTRNHDQQRGPRF